MHNLSSNSANTETKKCLTKCGTLSFSTCTWYKIIIFYHMQLITPIKINHKQIQWSHHYQNSAILKQQVNVQSRVVIMVISCLEPHPNLAIIFGPRTGVIFEKFKWYHYQWRHRTISDVLQINHCDSLQLTRWQRFDFATKHNSHRPLPEYLGHRKQQVNINHQMAGKCRIIVMQI